MFSDEERINLKMKRSHPIHSFLFAANVVLFTLVHNLGEVPAFYAIRALAVVVGLIAVVIWLFLRIVRDLHKAAVLATIFVVGLVNYKPFSSLLADISIAGLDLGRNRFLLPLYLLLLLVALLGTARSRRDMHSASGFLNIAGILLISMTLLQLGSGFVQLRKDGNAESQWAGVIEAERKLAADYRWQGSRDKSDIYYIILDGYARQDVLERDYQFDNSEFIDHLLDKGFFVAENSRSNYPISWLSVASSLNYDFVDSLVEASSAERCSAHLSQEMIANSKICRVLKDQGYQFHYYTSGFNVCLGSRYADNGPMYKWQYLSEFDWILLDNSLLWCLSVSAKSSAKRQFDSLEDLERIPRISDPTFTYMHFPCPHPPYIFLRDGRCPNAWQRTSNEAGYQYLEQVRYTNQRILEAVDLILRESDQPPIIIIQSDHGPDGLIWGFNNAPPSRSEQRHEWAIDVRTAIVNAFYFPGEAKEKLYDTVSPVNSFRILLNEYFDAEYELLPDTVHYSIPEALEEADTLGFPKRGYGFQDALDMMKPITFPYHTN